MRHKTQHKYAALQRGSLAGFIILIGFIIMSGPAHASVLTTQTVEGLTDFTDEAAMEWQPLAVEVPVGAGNIVRTDFDALADLLGDDGSFLEIAEATQLSVLEYDFDKAQQIRIARFAIIEGTVTADAAHLDYPTNIFDVETPTVTASFKFSKATISVDKDGNTTISGPKGIFEFSREGKKPGYVVVTYTSEISKTKNVIEIPNDGKIEVETTPDGLKINNTGNKSIILKVGDKLVILPAGGSLETVGDNVKNTGSTNIIVNGKEVEPGEGLPSSLLPGLRMIPSSQTGSTGGTGIGDGLDGPPRDNPRNNQRPEPFPITIQVVPVK